MMNIFNEHDSIKAIAALNAGKILVLRTDTVYGIVCRAASLSAVERIYQIKGRDDEKSPIVLVSSRRQLFDEPTPATARLLENVWPGKVSVIIPTSNAPVWIERGNGSVAYRLPDSDWLRTILDETGPLIAPSANLQGYPPARTIEQAIAYFGDTVDSYVDGGEVTDNTPSQLVRMTSDGKIERLR